MLDTADPYCESKFTFIVFAVNCAYNVIDTAFVVASSEIIVPSAIVSGFIFVPAVVAVYHPKNSYPLFIAVGRSPKAVPYITLLLDDPKIVPVLPSNVTNTGFPSLVPLAVNVMSAFGITIVGF